ncbi:MAG TPA: hypothetical protein VH134_00235, partial [Candidatus Dormibacteraeota bacterium]|nr:hypothetical protein [Candidatus Dormibacteraeota bacterium]
LNADQTALNKDTAQETADNNSLAFDQTASGITAICGSPTPCDKSNAQIDNDRQRVAADAAAVAKDQIIITTAQGNLNNAKAAQSADQKTGQAAVDAANAAVNNARQQGNADVQNAQASILQARATAASNVDNAQGTLNASIAQLQNAKIAYQNDQQTDSNGIAQAQTNADKSNHAAKGQLDEALTSLQNTLAEYSALTNGQIPQTVAQDAAQVTADQTQVRTNQDNVAGTQLIAPVDGTVQQVNVANGQAIGSAASSAGALAASSASGQPTATNNAQGNLTHAIVLTTPQAYQVSGPVSDAQLPLVHVGNQVNVLPAGGGEQLLGHVTAIAPSALITQGVATFTVTAVIDGINPNVHGGSTAQMSIVVERDVDVLTVPTSAVHTVGASSYVLVPRNGQQVPVTVTVGASDPSRTQILSGLNKGDQVILAEVGVRPPTGGAPGAGGAGGGGAGGGGTRGAGGGATGR